MIQKRNRNLPLSPVLLLTLIYFFAGIPALALLSGLGVSSVGVLSSGLVVWYFLFLLLLLVDASDVSFDLSTTGMAAAIV